MESDLKPYITAARQIGEVVGRDLLEGLVVCDDGRVCITAFCGPGSGTQRNAYFIELPDPDALSILRDRVWEAVREWADEHAGEYDWSRYDITIDILTDGPLSTDTLCRNTNLPSAVAAIHAHWKEQQ